MKLGTRSLRIAIVILLTLGACNSDDTNTGGSTDTAEKQPAPQALDVEIKRTGDLFEFAAPDEIEGGVVAMNVKNSTDMFLQAQLIRVDGDHTAQEALTIITSEEPQPIPEWISAPGGVVYLHAGKSKTANVTLTEGTYYLIDPDLVGDSLEGDVDPETVPNADKKLTDLGLLKKLVVTAGDAQGALPDADSTIVAKEYEFEIPALEAGTQTIQFRNEGKELHHVIAFPLLPDASFADVKAFVDQVGGAEGPGGPPPFDFGSSEGVAVVDGGQSLVTTMDLKAGKYAFVCFLNDRAGGELHLNKGMLSEVTVT